MRQFDQDVRSGIGRGMVPAAEGQKVIVHDGSREVHGYAVGAADSYVDVVWAVASGRQRRRAFPAEDVFVPAHSQQWAGVPIAAEGLRLAARAARVHAARPANGAAGHPHGAARSDHAA